MNERKASQPYRKAEDVYLTEDRFEHPKEIFKFLGKIIAGLNLPESARVLDMGCATGELIYFLMRQYPGVKFHGIDPSDAMIAKAKSVVANASFAVGGVQDLTTEHASRYDLAIFCGVMPYFEWPEEPLRRLLSAVRPGGSLIVFNNVNEDPIDTRVNYRSSLAEGTPWLPDCTFSKTTYERVLQSLNLSSAHEWHQFKIPFALPRQSDLIRAWTFDTKDNPHQLICGTMQLINLWALVIRRS